MHHRLIPRKNHFIYKSYNVLVNVNDLSCLNSWIFGHNKFRIFSIYEKDYGYQTSMSFQDWLDDLQQKFQIPIDNVSLMTMPRLMGYFFNPVSFWFFKDSQGKLIAVIADVNNTFGENHHYLIAHPSLEQITSQTSYDAKKIFHVSPFLPVEGHYKFRFHIPPFNQGLEEKIGIWINYYEKGKETLLTSVIGTIKPLKNKDLVCGLLRHFILPLKVLWLIHYQAIRLFLKRIPFHKKPAPPKERMSK